MNRTALKVGVFHPGTQHSWQTALAFQEGGCLRWYATSVFYDPRRWPYRLENLLPRQLSARLHREFTRRYLPALLAENVRQFGAWEWVETIARRSGAERLARWANDYGNARFGAMVIRLIEREPVDVVWGYNTSSAEVFRWAKRRGIRCVLDQTIGHCASMNKIMLAEQVRHPDFFLDTFTPFPAEDIARQQEEIALADTVVVGSRYCADTLIEHGCNPAKICIVPYGYDETLFPAWPPRRAPLEGRPIECLFVGSIYPRKGIAALLNAFANVAPEKARLTLVGRLAIPGTTFDRFRNRVNHVGSLPRGEVVKHFLAADCFVFPSLFEGGGIVLYEACASGLGIIQSANCGDGVRDNRNGQILPEVSAAAVEAAVSALASEPWRLKRWQAASWEMRLDRTWRRYRDHVRALVSA